MTIINLGLYGFHLLKFNVSYGTVMFHKVCTENNCYLYFNGLLCLNNVERTASLDLVNVIYVGLILHIHNIRIYIGFI